MNFVLGAGAGKPVTFNVPTRDFFNTRLAGMIVSGDI
jgi:hypothetical protein